MTRRALRHTTGFSSLEAIVSFTLLSAVLTFATPLVIKHGRLMSAQRDYRLALDEVSNQLERLTDLPTDQLATAVGQTMPSDPIRDRLLNAKVRGELSSAEWGQKLTVRLTWSEANQRTMTIALAAWIPRRAPSTSGDATEAAP
jgi:hypothetical protein